MSDLVPVVQIDKLSRAYYKPDGSVMVKALNNVSLSFYPGEMIAIMGGSGSGKSTLLNIIGCLDQSSTGTYLLNNVDVSKLSEKNLSKLRGEQIGFIFQSFNLISELNIVENVEVPLIYQRISPSHRRKKSLEMLKLVELEGRLDHLPKELSGGQQQRVAIARALVTNPSLILADEPTGNLDSNTSKKIMELFMKLHEDKKRTIVFVTHDDRLANTCDRIVRLNDGQLIN